MSLSAPDQVARFLAIPGEPIAREHLDVDGRETTPAAASMLRLRKRSGSGLVAIRVDAADPRFTSPASPGDAV